MAARLPRIALRLPAEDTAGDGIALATAEAVMQLAERSVVELVPDHGRDGAAGIVHTVGSAGQTYRRERAAAAARVPWVHSLAPIPVGRRRPSRSAGATRSSITPLDPDWYLVHGQAAWRTAIDSGLVPTERTHCAPVLSVASDALAEPAHTTRRVQRQLLDIPPGVRIVLGCGARRDPGRRVLQGAVHQLRRADVVAIWVDADQRAEVLATEGQPARAVPDAVNATSMLLAADVFVATSDRVGTASVGALAIDLGIHTIAESSDPCAELLSGGRGIVVANDDVAAVAAALRSVVDDRRRALDAGGRRARRVEQLAQSIARLYERALERPAALRVAG